jgi:hypothetical protein
MIQFTRLRWTPLFHCATHLSPEANPETLFKIKLAFASVRHSKSAGSDCISSVLLRDSFESIKYHLVAFFSLALGLTIFQPAGKQHQYSS